MTTTVPAAELNATADFDASRITHLSIHTAAFDVTGAGEAVGGAPAYSRLAPTFNPAGTVGPLGAVDQPATVGVAWSSQVIFDVPGGAYTNWGAWNAVAVGIFRRGNLLTTPQSPGSQGQVKLSIGVGPYAGA